MRHHGGLSPAASRALAQPAPGPPSGLAALAVLAAMMCRYGNAATRGRPPSRPTRTRLQRLAAGQRRDHHAVRAGPTLQHSSGRIEGHRQQDQTIKRQVSGRAGFDPLRTRVLHAD